MALEIAYSMRDALSLHDALQALDAVPPQLDDDEKRDHAIGILAGLYANRDFLADAALDTLKSTYHDETRPVRQYGPQVITLGAARPGWFLRANIWPAQNDYAVRTSGEDAFFYSLPHDHNFDFLTIGYAGPGYISDYYEQDYNALSGYHGEAANLKFVERSALTQGRMLYYRKHVDVHCQHAPPMLSISLNIMMTAPEQYWFDQCRYDVERNIVDGILSQSANQALLHIAMAAGSDNGKDLVYETLRHHPSDRMRITALQTLFDHSPSPSARHDMLCECLLHGTPALAGYARALLSKEG